MGDSITEGQYVDPPHRWVDQAIDRLTRAYAGSDFVLRFVISGISGETTRQGLERFPEAVQRHQPDIMTLQFGLNDGNCWATDWGVPRVSEQAYRANLIEMIARARVFGASRIVLGTNHATLRRERLISGASIESQRVKYNEIVRDVAREADVDLHDVARVFDNFDDKKLAELLLPYPDLLHLSKAGHNVYLESIETHLKQAIDAVIAERKAEGELRNAG